MSQGWIKMAQPNSSAALKQKDLFLLLHEWGTKENILTKFWVLGGPVFFNDESDSKTNV